MLSNFKLYFTLNPETAEMETESRPLKALVNMRKRIAEHEETEKAHIARCLTVKFGKGYDQKKRRRTKAAVAMKLLLGLSCSETLFCKMADLETV